jgi:hypothetical protein
VVPDVALMEDDVTSGHVDRFQAASELLDGGQGQHLQHGHRVQHVDVAVAHADGPVHSS